MIKAPVRAPKARAHAERWVGSLRRECLDRPLIVRRRQLESVLAVYVRHYNEHRPHRSLDQHPPLSKPPQHGQVAYADISRSTTFGDAISLADSSTNTSPRIEPFAASSRQGGNRT